MKTKEYQAIDMSVFICESLEKWEEEFFFIVKCAEEDGDFWMFTVDAANIFRSSGLLVSNYRTLAETSTINFNNDRARQTVKENLQSVKHSLISIINSDPFYAEELEELFEDLCRMEDNLISI